MLIFVAKDKDMAAQRIGIMVIKQLILLKQSGYNNRKCSKHLSVGRNAINRYVKALEATGQSWDELAQMDEQSIDEMFPSKETHDPGKYETLAKQFEYFSIELKKTGCTRQTLWEKYLVQNPEGYGYTQFNVHYNRWLKQKKGSGKLTHEAGDKIYIDFCGQTIPYVDRETGEVIEVQIFVGILPCSQYTFVQAYASQCKEDFVNAVSDCLEFFGGSPNAIVPDNLKSAVTKASKYSPKLNKTLQDRGLHYGSVINPTRAYSPQDKALVEGAVRLVYQRIFYPLNEITFHSIAEINESIKELLDNYNKVYKLSHIKISRHQLFLNVEKTELKSLPQNRYEIRHFKRLTVQKIGFIFLNDYKNYYSVPHRLIGKKLEVRYNAKTVEVYYDSKRVAGHLTSKTAGKYTLQPDHLSSQHQFYSEWSPEYFYKLAIPIGETTASYVRQIIDRADYPETAYKQCLGIIHLHKDYGKKRVDQACKRGHKWDRYSYWTIKQILTNKMDLLEDQEEENQSDIPDHDNIRGPEYYEQLLNE